MDESRFAELVLAGGYPTCMRDNSTACKHHRRIVEDNPLTGGVWYCHCCAVGRSGNGGGGSQYDCDGTPFHG